jgi:transcription-repair coupling factor (superfamily II helicase)
LDLSPLTKLFEGAPSLVPLRHRSTGLLTVGAADSAKTVIAAAIARSSDGPVLFLSPRPARAEVMAEELTAWLGDETPVHQFPERDALPYERIAPDRDAVRARLLVLSALSKGSRCVVVTSALALAQRTLSLGEWSSMAITFKPGDSIDMEAMLRRLAQIGYSIQSLVQESGQAARRGGIIDVFPSTSSLPVRIEFVGREIDTIRSYDPLTQRSVEPVAEVEVLPAREFVVGDAAPLSSLDLSSLTVERQDLFEEEMALLRSGEVPSAVDFYVPFLASGTLIDHLPAGSRVVIDEEPDIAEAIDEAIDEAARSRSDLEERGELPGDLPSPINDWSSLKAELLGVGSAVHFSRWATAEEAHTIRPAFVPATAYAGQLRKLVNDVASSAAKVVIVSQQADRLAEIFSEEGSPVAVSASLAAQAGKLSIIRGSLSEGWRFSSECHDLELITDTEVFGFVKQRRAPPRRSLNREAFLAELVSGSYLVHIDHGVARLHGLVRREVEGVEREYLELHYAEGDKLFVPTDQLDRVTRYIGPSDRMPHPTRLGSGEWQRAKARVKKSMQVLARELLALYAAREVLPGRAFPPDTAWQMELEASFPYVETPDQLAAISAVKQDMETPRPMDRLICGDVGYGKTEVAIRAAFKAAMDGKQVAILVPTTVLAQQHYQTFTERLGAFPVTVDVLSRFRSDAEQRQIVERLGAGGIDIIIGTHRLLQKDVSLKDLGLLVIDEEQRFGVAHKEHLKKMRREVDVLTLSATPIPRTLYMALGEIRDMSTMETPPEDRLPIKTYVAQFDERLVHEAIVRELERGGQVYFVHNRVHNIEMIADKVRDIAPAARVSIGHGQMDEKLLAQAMQEFVSGRSDVLVCTTIIESGLDIPNVNTIIINQADRLGLAQLYQLRGRVGRGAHRAYAYLLYDRRSHLSEVAKQRLQAIFEATELGAGFQIAMRDLEIRGAGNLLGPEQSGFMAAVGFDLYVKLLAGAVEHTRALMRGEVPPPERDGTGVPVDLPISAHLPPSYVSDINLRLALYQRLSAAPDPQRVADIGGEMTDRFGTPPAAVRNLLYVAALRAIAGHAGAQSVVTESGVAVVRFYQDQPLPRERLEAVAPRGVTVGNSVLRVELGNGWRERLRRSMELVLEARRPDAVPVVI